ncbi:MAG: LysM peptidoglycan-binding domain-containing protein [Planctomycetaceae bacterium]
MEQDTRIGLAMGILLIGIVGALFFRNEQTPERAVPELADTESLDAQIAERPIAPYLSRTGESNDATDPIESQVQTKPKAWAVPEFLKQDRAATVPATSPTAPDPIRREPVPPPVEETVVAKPVPRPPDQPIVSVAPAKTEAEPAETENALSEYRVRQGDTLSDIASRFLGSSARYMEIYELNKDRLRTPHDLRVGRRILVPRSRQ